MGEISAGGGAPQNADAFSNDGTPFIRAGSLSPLVRGTAESAFEHLTEKVAKDHGLRKFPRDTIVFAKSGMSATKGLVYRLRGEAYVVNHLAAIIPNERIVPGFLEHALRVFSPVRLIRDASYPSIRLSDIAAMQIPLPSLTEQNRISEVLNGVEGMRAKRRSALAQLDSLYQSIFRDLFGDPTVNPEGWPRVEFDELLEAIDSGWSPKCLDRSATSNEWGVLKLGAVTRCEYDASENKALPSGVAPDPSIEVKDGDLLFTRKNTYDLVAACVLVRKTRPRLLMSDLIFRLKLKPNAKIEASFLHQLLIYPTKRREIQKLARGSAGSMPNISKTRLKKALIEVPPLSLQREFASHIDALEKMKTRQRASLEKMNALFASLQHRAFRGELT